MSGQARAMDTAVATVVAAVTVLTFVLTVFGRRDLKRLSKVALAPPPWSRLTPLVSASLSVFCVQILISGGRLLDRSYTSTMDQGSLAAAEYSYAIIMATAQLIGTSSNLVLAPAIGLSLKQHNRISHAIWEHIGVIAFATTAVSLVFIFASKPIISLVYEHGAFTSSSTLLTSEFFRFLSIGLLPLILGLIFTQIVILQGDQKKLIGFAVGKLTAKAITLFGLAILFPDKIIMAIGLSFVAAETFMVFACGLYVWKVHLKSQE
jgi:putative peptidoglycan lipid II flippase